MKTYATIAAIAGLTALPLSAASAQSSWTPGAEIVGQSIQVETAGVTNTVYFDQGGVARIMTPQGRVVPANWTAANNQLCLNSASAQECWPYQSPFAAGKAINLTSSCNATSQWLPTAVNEAAPGERG